MGQPRRHFAHRPQAGYVSQLRLMLPRPLLSANASRDVAPQLDERHDLASFV